jgi:uncharacterized protein (DUF111 family)
MDSDTKKAFDDLGKDLKDFGKRVDAVGMKVDDVIAITATLSNAQTASEVKVKKLFQDHKSELLELKRIVQALPDDDDLKKMINEAAS